MRTHEVQAVLELAELFPEAACSEIAAAVTEALDDDTPRKHLSLATLAAAILSEVLARRGAGA